MISIAKTSAEGEMGFPRTRKLMLFAICCMCSHISAHAEDHGKKAREHLQEAIESGKKGNAADVLFHTEEARRELIEDNKEHPYTQLQKPIYGEHEKAEHDKEAFEDIDEAIDEAEDGDAKDAAEAAARASAHLKEKEEAK